MNAPIWFSTTIESINPKNISDIDIIKIHEIEQDMWAEWIWEYLKCDSCWEIYSKKDIYGDLTTDIYNETVAQIEKIIWFKWIDCEKCWDETSHIWGKEYLDEIRTRYNDEEAFLTIIRNNIWEVIWFSDVYINNLETIYKREFEHYYFEIWSDKIRKMIWVILNWNVPQKILMHSTTGIESKYANLGLFLSILSELYKHLQSQWYNDILWLYEACIWSTAHSLYHVAGAKRIWLNIDNLKWKNKYKDSVSDIFVHENIVPSIIETFSLPVKIFIKKYSTKMKQVLVR